MKQTKNYLDDAISTLDIPVKKLTFVCGMSMKLCNLDLV